LILKDMLGELIYEQKGKVTGQRVLDVSPPRVETTFSATGSVKGGSTVSEMGTYWSEARSPGILYGEVIGTTMTNDGTELATWKGAGIGRMSGAGKVSFRGAIYWSTTSTGKLASLNNVVGVFEYEVDEAGNTSAKVWEWK
jgi:hypothetical protein